MSVSTKFYVTKIDGLQVFLSVVVRGVENREWSAATPSGSMMLYITNPAAMEQFTVGEEWEFVGRQTPKPSPMDGHPVDHYVDHPASGINRNYHVCKTCGSYASLREDGSPDWTRHDEVYGSTPEQRGEAVDPVG